jgi:hypothetical protein
MVSASLQKNNKPDKFHNQMSPTVPFLSRAKERGKKRPGSPAPVFIFALIAGERP